MTREDLLSILHEIRPDVDFSDVTDIATGGVLKSMELMMLIAEIEDAADIELPVEDVVPENFESVDTILALLAKLGAS